MILLAGGTGTLGRRVVPLLVARGLDVRILARHAGAATPIDDGKVQRVAADIRDRPAVDAAMTGVDTVVSMIQGVGGASALGPQVVDRDGNLTLIQAAVANGVRHFVLVSVIQASADHPIELFRMKFIAETALRASGLSWTILRPTASMETWLGVVGRPLVEGGRTRIFGRGQNPINFVAADDVARFVEMAVTDPAVRMSVIDVAGPANLTFDQFVAVVGEVTGRAGPIDHVPLAVLRIMATVFGPVRPVMAGQIRTALVMDDQDMRADAESRQRLAPSIPATPLAEVVRRTFPPQSTSA